MAGSWRNLGKFSAESRHRQVLGKFSADLKTSKGCRKDSLVEAKKLPGCPKGAERGAKRHPKGLQNRTKSSLYFQIIFGCLPGCHLHNCAPHFGSILDAFWEPKSFMFHVIFWLHFWMHFWRHLAAFLMLVWALLGGLFWYFSRLREKWRTPRKHCK